MFSPTAHTLRGLMLHKFSIRHCFMVGLCHLGLFRLRIFLSTGKKQQIHNILVLYTAFQIISPAFLYIRAGQNKGFRHFPVFIALAIYHILQFGIIFRWLYTQRIQLLLRLCAQLSRYFFADLWSLSYLRGRGGSQRAQDMGNSAPANKVKRVVNFIIRRKYTILSVYGTDKKRTMLRKRGQNRIARKEELGYNRGMHCCSAPKGSLYFELFGVPVLIKPGSWIVLALLGGGLGISSGADVSGVLIFMVAGMLCLLVHEFGHALSGRALGGGEPSIEIAGLGGATYTPYPPRTRMGYFFMVLAGPLASLGLGILGGFIFGLLYLGNPIAGIVISLLEPLGISIGDWAYVPLVDAIASGQLSIFALNCFYTLFMICTYWSIFNLLPIFPLDGGKLLGTLIDNYRIAAMVGLVLCGVLCVLCTICGMWFNMMLCGYLAAINWQYLRSFHKEG